MSKAHIYIVADGLNTKIGITTDFEKRMASYVTHNPTARLFKSYSCTLEDAKRIELTIKTAFKNKLSSSSREWFSVSPSIIDRYVSTLLYTHIQDEVLPSMHGVQLPNEAYELLKQLSVGIEKRQKTDPIKEEFAELFAAKFNLGIPEHKLPDETVFKDGMAVDFNYCNLKSDIVKNGIKTNYIRMPFDDHCYRFFHLNRLSSGHYGAFCSAEVSMPYLEAIQKREDIDEIIEAANDLGWYCTLHNDWSWWYPNKTALILYQPKTPITNKLALFDKSFRKWVIERREILKHEPYSNREDLEKVIEDTVYDNTFPLDVGSFDDLCNKYLKPFWGITADDEYDEWLKDSYRYLFEKWEGNNKRNKTI
jgi:hypothetical protein